APEILDLDNGVVAGGGELDGHHAAGHYNRAASERSSSRRPGFRAPGERVQGVAQDLPALAMADFATIDRQARRQLREIEPAPIADWRPNDNPGIPYVARNHRCRTQPFVVVAQILEQFDRRHTTFNRAGGAVAPRSADPTKCQVFTETQCYLRLDA